MATKKVKETVDTVKTEAKEAAKKLSKKAESAAKAVSEKAEPAVKKAKSAAKAVGEKADPAVKAAKSAAKAATDVAKKTTSAAKTAGKKVVSALSDEVYVEMGGNKFDCSNVIERCKEDYKSKHKGERIHSCKIYIKPEDGAVYYVINELADKISL